MRPDTYRVVIECDTEAQAVDLTERLRVFSRTEHVLKTAILRTKMSGLRITWEKPDSRRKAKA